LHLKGGNIAGLICLENDVTITRNLSLSTRNKPKHLNNAITVSQANVNTQIDTRIIIVKKTLKYKIGALWATIAQKQQISGDFI
jgi:hypothetical protein